MIFLFSNRGYGGPFVRSAAGYARWTGAAIMAVRSGRGDRERRLRGARAGPLHDLVRRWRSAHDPDAGALPTITVDDVNDRSFVASIAPDDVGIIAGFDQIFSVESIGRFRSLAHWCLDNGETATGFTIHTVTRRIDSGEIHYQEMLSIDPHGKRAIVGAAHRVDRATGIRALARPRVGRHAVDEADPRR